MSADKRFRISEFCDVMVNGEKTIVCHIGNGNTLKLTTECWNIVEKYINDYSIEEICNATADSDDKEYMENVFSTLIKKGMLVNDCETKIKSVEIEITHRCNLSCIHCCANASSALEEDKLTTENMREVIDKIIELDPESIVVTGGEPMLRTDFFEISRYLRRRYAGHLNLMTNGLLINDENVEELVSIYDGYNISLDGYDEYTCSKIRGKGVFGKVINAINLLITHGVDSKHIAVSMVETVHTYGKTYLFDELNHKLGTISVVRVFSPMGRGEKNRAYLEIKEKEVYDEKKELPTCQSCLAGRGKIAINYEGDIYPCMLLNEEKYSLGNVLEINSLKRFFEEKHSRDTKGYINMKNLMPQYLENCRTCNVRAFCVHCYPEFRKYVENDNFKELCKYQREALQYIWEVWDVHNMGNNGM